MLAFHILHQKDKTFLQAQAKSCQAIQDFRCFIGSIVKFFFIEKEQFYLKTSSQICPILTRHKKRIMRNIDTLKIFYALSEINMVDSEMVATSLQLLRSFVEDLILGIK